MCNTELCGGDCNNPNEDLQDYDPIICDAWQDKKQNVFLKPPAPNPIEVFDITVDGDNINGEDGTPCTGNQCYICFDITNGKLKLRLQGKGDHVMISRYEGS